MAKKYYSTLTKIGLNAVARATTMNEKVKFSKFCLGDAEINPDVNTIALGHEVWQGAISSIVVDENNPSWIVLTCIISATVGGFTIREVGIKDEDGNLLAVASYPETYKPVLAEGAGKDLIVRVILEVSNTEAVELKIDPTVSLATRADLEAIEKKKADKEDVKKLEKKVETVEEKVTEGVENLDVSGKQIEFAEAATRTLPKTGDTLKVIVAKITKYLKDIKTVAFTGKYSDLTEVPTSFPPSAHNHDDRYLGLRAKATDSDKLDGHDSTYFAPATHNHDDKYASKTTVGVLHGLKTSDKSSLVSAINEVKGQISNAEIRINDGQLEVKVGGEWQSVGKSYTKNKVLTSKIEARPTDSSQLVRTVEYSGSPGMLKYILLSGGIIKDIILDGETLPIPNNVSGGFFGDRNSFLSRSESPSSSGYYGYRSYCIGLEFKKSIRFVWHYTGNAEGNFACLLQTEK